MKRAVVFSGGGNFGAWQAGVWRGLQSRLSSKPDLIVGASVGSLNGYAIAGGATPAQLRDLWLTERYGSFSDLSGNIRELMKHPSRIDFAVVITDLLRLKPRIVRGPEVTWQHLAA